MHFRIYYLHLKSIYKKPSNTIFFSLGFPEVVNSLDIPESESCSVMSDSLLLHGLWNSPGQNTGVGSLSLLQGIFTTQGPNRGLRIVGRFFTSWATREAQEYWSGYPIPSPVDLPDPGIELGSPELQADSLPTELSGKTWVKWKS